MEQEEYLAEKWKTTVKHRIFLTEMGHSKVCSKEPKAKFIWIKRRKVVSPLYLRGESQGSEGKIFPVDPKLCQFCSFQLELLERNTQLQAGDRRPPALCHQDFEWLESFPLILAGQLCPTSGPKLTSYGTEISNPSQKLNSLSRDAYGREKQNPAETPHHHHHHHHQAIISGITSDSSSFCKLPHLN